jgi:hypothetical protein
VERSRVRFPMRSLDFSVVLILCSHIMALGSTHRQTEIFRGAKCGRRLRLTTSPTSHNLMCLCGVLQGQFYLYFTLLPSQIFGTDTWIQNEHVIPTVFPGYSYKRNISFGSGAARRLLSLLRSLRFSKGACNKCAEINFAVTSTLGMGGGGASKSMHHFKGSRCLNP